MLFFFYGTLRSEVRLRSVLVLRRGAIRMEPALLEGFEARRAPGADYPFAVRRRGASLEGVLVDVPSRRMVLRLIRHEGLEYRIARLTVRDTHGARRRAAVFLPRPGVRISDGPWDFDSWWDSTVRRGGGAG